MCLVWVSTTQPHLIRPPCAQAGRSLPCATHRLVALAVLEAFVRYSRVLQQPHALPALQGVVMAFLDDRGLGHPSEARGGRGLGGLGRVWGVDSVCVFVCVCGGGGY